MRYPMNLTDTELLENLEMVVALPAADAETPEWREVARELTDEVTRRTLAAAELEVAA